MSNCECIISCLSFENVPLSFWWASVVVRPPLLTRAQNVVLYRLLMWQSTYRQDKYAFRSSIDGYRTIRPSNDGILFGFDSSKKSLKLYVNADVNKDKQHDNILSSRRLNTFVLFLNTNEYSSDYPYAITISVKLFITSTAAEFIKLTILLSFGFSKLCAAQKSVNDRPSILTTIKVLGKSSLLYSYFFTNSNLLFDIF